MAVEHLGTWWRPWAPPRTASPAAGTCSRPLALCRTAWAPHRTALRTLAVSRKRNCLPAWTAPGTSARPCWAPLPRRSWRRRLHRRRGPARLQHTASRGQPSKSRPVAACRKHHHHQWPPGPSALSPLLAAARKNLQSRPALAVARRSHPAARGPRTPPGAARRNRPSAAAASDALPAPACGARPAAPPAAPSPAAARLPAGSAASRRRSSCVPRSAASASHTAGSSNPPALFAAGTPEPGRWPASPE
mmetsp:Transcript_39453/g.122926  ORF Transcript_39453/g.122926 Transcript_39453/m.122926 type:complete len:248 (-) Transcript_39453:862-1605(-)